MRVVSTLASGTEIVAELGIGEQLVGISHECDYPPDLMHLPRVSRPRFDPGGLTSGEIDRAVRDAMLEGGVYELDGPLLARLDPDLVLGQALCEVCAVPTAGLADVLAEQDLPARILSLDSHTIEEILESILAVGRAAGVEAVARARVEALRGRLDGVARGVSRRPRPRALAVEWLDPPFVPGHWVPEMIEAAGAECLAGEAGRPSRQATWSELRGFDPDVLIIMPCGYGIEAARRDAEAHAERLTEIAPRAVAQGRAFVVDASAYFNRSGPRFVTGVEILAGLFHPGALPAPEPAAAAAWRPSARAAAQSSKET